MVIFSSSPRNVHQQTCTIGSHSQIWVCKCKSFPCSQSEYIQCILNIIYIYIYIHACMYIIFPCFISFIFSAHPQLQAHDLSNRCFSPHIASLLCHHSTVRPAHSLGSSHSSSSMAWRWWHHVGSLLEFPWLHLEVQDGPLWSLDKWDITPINWTYKWVTPSYSDWFLPQVMGFLHAVLPLPPRTWWTHIAPNLLQGTRFLPIHRATHSEASAQDLLGSAFELLITVMAENIWV